MNPFNQCIRWDEACIRYPSLTTSQPLKPHVLFQPLMKWPGPCKLQPDSSRYNLTAPSLCLLSPSTYPSLPAPELSNAKQGFGARRYPSHAHAFATQEHRGVILYGPLLTNSDRSQWIDVSSFQPLSRHFWDAFYMLPEKCWGIKHPLPLAVGNLTM